MDDELLEYVDRHGRALGVAPRDVVHRNGLWHRTFHCIVVRPDPPARVVLQRRRLGARAFPGMIDLSVTGHLAAGEAPLDGVREIREELGLIVDPARLVSIGQWFIDDEHGEGHNRELAQVYLLADDTPLDQFQLDADHVAGLVELRVADLRRMLDDVAPSAPATRVDLNGTVTRIDLTSADLVPDTRGYWQFLTQTAERFVSGPAA